MLSFVFLAKQGGKIPVLIEAFVQDIKIQLHMKSEEISSSGSLGSIKATVMSLSKLIRVGYRAA
jgi:hypothetical protein